MPKAPSELAEAKNKLAKTKQKPAKAQKSKGRGGASKSLGYRVVAGALLCVAAVTLASLTLHGWEYYVLPIQERVRHPLYRELRSSGTLGIQLAFVGTGLLALNLLYMVKRRWKSMRQRFGSKRLWLEIHVFCGLVGPALLAFHSGFLFRNPIGVVTAISTAVVVVTGLVGRYLYAQIPRSVHGRALALADLQRQQKGLIEEIAEQLSSCDLRDRVLACAAPEPPKRVTGPRLVWASLKRDLSWVSRWWQLRRMLRTQSMTAARKHAVLRATRSLFVVGLQTTHLLSFQRVLSRWRGMHLKLAWVMIACVVIHIASVTVWNR